jgi:hypothetical protein
MLTDFISYSNCISVEMIEVNVRVSVKVWTTVIQFSATKYFLKRRIIFLIKNFYEPLRNAVFTRACQ